MQRFTAKEVKPSTGEGKPTIITTVDGSKMSGFQSSLSTMKPGTVFECETELKKGYTNIKGEPKIIEEGNGSPTTRATGNGYGQDTPEKRASIETMNAITNVMTAYVGMMNGDVQNQPSIKLDDLWGRALAWCGSRIPLPGQMVEVTKVGDKERTQNDTGLGKVEHIPGIPFKDAGQFWTAAQQRWEKSQTEFVTILALNNAKEVTDLDWTWLELEKKLG